jgi:hypothetical protein
MASLRTLAYVTCGDWHTAEDAVANALARLYPRWDRLERPDLYAQTMTSDAPPLRTDVEAIIAATGAAAMTVMAALGVTAIAAIAVPRGRSHPPAPIPEGAAPAPVTFPVPDGPFTFTIKAYDVGSYRVRRRPR